FEIVNADNDTLEFGFQVGYTLKSNAGDLYGNLVAARYEIPIYDLAIDPATGLPAVDAAGNGIIALNADGSPAAPLPPATGRGDETAPIALGQDGIRDSGDEAQTLSIGHGRDLNLITVEGGAIIASYIGDDEHVHIRLWSQVTDEITDRDPRTTTQLG